MKRVVVDPSVLISAFVGNPDAGPARLVDAWGEQRFVMVVSPRLLAELDGVLSRPKFAHRTRHQRGAAYVASFAARSEHHPDPDDDGGHVRDADDDYPVALAHAAAVDAIISLDRDLLDAQLAGLAVMDPARFLAILTRRLGHHPLRDPKSPTNRLESTGIVSASQFRQALQTASVLAAA